MKSRIVATALALVLASGAATAGTYRTDSTTWTQEGVSDLRYNYDKKACVDKVELDLLSDSFDDPMFFTLPSERMLNMRAFAKEAYADCMQGRGWQAVGPIGPAPIQFYP